MIPITAVPYPVAANGDLMTVREWAECVACGGFIDYDGMGVWSDGTYVIGMDAPWSQALHHSYIDGMLASHLPPITDQEWIYPSQLAKGTLVRPAWATHVCWYNR